MWSYYLYYGKLGIGVGYYGVIAAAFALVCGLGGKVAHLVEKKYGERITFCLPLLIGPSLLLLGQIQSVYALALIYLNGFLWGLSTPLLRDFIHKRTKSSIRATVLSVTSMGGRLGYVIISILVGKIIDLSSLQNAHTFLGIVLLGGGSYSVFSLLRQRQS